VKKLNKPLWIRGSRLGFPEGSKKGRGAVKFDMIVMLSEDQQKVADRQFRYGPLTPPALH
jgi:hypothetical protein